MLRPDNRRDTIRLHPGIAALTDSLTARGLDVDAPFVFGVGAALTVAWEASSGALVTLQADVVERAASVFGVSIDASGAVDGDASMPSATQVRERLVAQGQAFEDGPSADGLYGLPDQIAALDADGARRAAGAILVHDGGGAAWRRVYRDFFGGLDAVVPAADRQAIRIAITRAGDAWQTLGEELLRYADGEASDAEQARRFALAVQMFEETLWSRLAALA